MTQTTPLMVRLPNWVGDVIMALPALEALHQSGFQLHLYGRGWIHDLLSGTPYTLHTLDKSFLKARHTLASHSAQQALLLTNSFSSALQFRSSLKQTMGFNTDARRLLLNHPINKQQGPHEVEQFYTLAQAAAQQWGHTALPATPPSLKLPLDPNIEASLFNKLPQLKQRQYWAICPFATGTTRQGVSKIWPYWQNLVQYLHQQGIDLIICPGPGEEPLCQPYLPYSECLEGLSLSEYAVILKHAQQVVANDSGPMHIASCTGTKTLGLFGVTDPERTHPWESEYLGSLNQWPSLEDALKQLNQNPKAC